MLDKLKIWLVKKVEKNTVKIDLEWVDSDGNKWKESDVLLKRSRLPIVGDWGRIYPPVTEDGKKILWINFIFGGKKNFIKLLIILFIVAMFLFGYYEIINNSKELLNNACVQSCIDIKP